MEHIGKYIIVNCRVWYDEPDWVECRPLMIFKNNKQAREWAINN